MPQQEHRVTGYYGGYTLWSRKEGADMSPTEKRRKAAQAALRTFAEQKDGAVKKDWQPCQEDVIDLLTDLRHFCTGESCSFDDAVRISAYHFTAETAEKGGRS